jgi:putative phosphonate transport system ATP-binding protein
MDPIIEVKNISKNYGNIKALENVSFSIWPGEILGIVGESGSGKSTLIKCLSGETSCSEGEIVFYKDNEQIYFSMLDEGRMHLLRKKDIKVVYQNSQDGLRMKFSAGANIAEPLLSLGSREYSELRDKAVYWMDRLEIGQNRTDHIPENFSGGMRQRLQIARSLVSNPKILLMDEPTSGLDLSVQARLLDVIGKLVKEINLTVVIVTHDLGVARILADRLIVMKSGKIAEHGLTDQILDDPGHEYTQLLVSSVLRA